MDDLVVRARTDREAFGSLYDLYYPEVAPTGPLYVGRVLVSVPGIPLRFETKHKNPLSTGYNFGLDSIEVRRRFERWDVRPDN